MKKVGEVREIWRYPVKGMAGEQLQAAELGAQGLAGDRIWAVRDRARREIQSCKFRPELLRCAARVSAASPAQVDVVFPDGSTLAGADAAAHVRVSQLIGHESTLEPLRPPSDLAFYRRHRTDDHTWLDELKATFERVAGEPLPGLFDDVPAAAAEFVVQPGTFFLVTPFHLLTTATLAWLKGLHPPSDWDARRFRPNVVIDTGTGARGLVEQGWIGQQVILGGAALACPFPTPRCGAITRAQHGLPADTSVLRTVVKHAGQNVGIYGTPVTGGAFRVGDAVYVADPA
jgi:uncharacterized protein YcbX